MIKAKKWVQLSHSQAKIIRYSYTKFPLSRIDFHNTTQFILYSSIIATAFSFFTSLYFLHFFDPLVDFIAQFIQSNSLHGEPISKTTKERLSFVFSISVLFFAMLITIFLSTVVVDELIFDLDEKTITHIVQSNLSQLFKREGSVKKFHLSHYAKVSIRVSSHSDSDGEVWYFYSLEMISDPPGNNFQIDCSDGKRSEKKIILL